MGGLNEESLERLAYFVAVADGGSFQSAAETLNVTEDQVADEFEALERELRVTLALRTRETVRLTSSGQAAYRAAVATLAGADAIPQDDEPERIEHAPILFTAPPTAPREVTGEVRITLPCELAAHWLPSRLLRLKRDHADIAVHVDANDHGAALRDGPFDIAVRTGYQLPGVTPRGETLRLVLAARTNPRVDIARHGVLLTDTPLINGAYAEIAVTRDPASGRVRPLQSTRGLTANNRDAAIAMARNGLGAVLATEAALAHDLATGTLEPVLPDWDFGAITVSVALRDAEPSAAAKAVASALLPNRHASRGGRSRLS